jgi:hypothetical protein
MDKTSDSEKSTELCWSKSECMKKKSFGIVGSSTMPSPDVLTAFRELEVFLEESAKSMQTPSMFTMQPPAGEMHMDKS